MTYNQKQAGFQEAVASLEKHIAKYWLVVQTHLLHLLDPPIRPQGFQPELSVSIQEGHHWAKDEKDFYKICGISGIVCGTFWIPGKVFVVPISNGEQ